MASFNRVILMGNLTRDPESRQAQSGTVVVRAGLAVNDRVPDGNGGWRDEPSFIDLVLFGKRGEAFAKYLGKGKSVLIEGKIRQSRWEDRETGQKRSKLEVIVDDWNFAGGREGGQGGGGQANDTYAQQAPDFPSRQDFGAKQAQGGAADSFDDDVPF